MGRLVPEAEGRWRERIFSIVSVIMDALRIRQKPKTGKAILVCKNIDMEQINMNCFNMALLDVVVNVCD